MRRLALPSPCRSAAAMRLCATMIHPKPTAPGEPSVSLHDVLHAVRSQSKDIQYQSKIIRYLCWMTAGLSGGLLFLNLKVDRLEERVEHNHATLLGHQERCLPAFRAQHCDQRCVIDDVRLDTVTVVEGGGKTYLLSCAHAMLHFQASPPRVELRLPAGFKALGVVMSPAYLASPDAIEHDLCLVEVDAPPSHARVHVPTTVAAAAVGDTVGGFSYHGECHGRVGSIRDDIPLLQGLASPGTSGTLLFRGKGQPIGLLQGLDGESTSLTTAVTDVGQFSLGIARSMDMKRYSITPLRSATEIQNAMPVPLEETSPTPGALCKIPVSGTTLELPPWLQAHATRHARKIAGMANSLTPPARSPPSP